MTTRRRSYRRNSYRKSNTKTNHYKELIEAMRTDNDAEVKYLLDHYSIDISTNNYEPLIVGIGNASRRAVKALVQDPQFREHVDCKKALMAMATIMSLSNPDMPAKYKKMYLINKNNPFNPHGHGREDWVKNVALFGGGLLLGAVLL